jgi:lysophospholipase L1-like esterase
MPQVNDKKVLIFGDSLSTGAHSPGGAMARELAAGGAVVKLDTKVGRSAWNFFGLEDTAAHFREAAAFKADYAIVQLGTNDIGLSIGADQNRMIQIRDALAATGAKVFAIGPPAFDSGVSQSAGAPAVVKMMRDVFGGRFIDMRDQTADMTKNRTADGVHCTATGGDIVGHRLAQAFLQADGGIGIFALVVIAALAYAILL